MGVFLILVLFMGDLPAFDFKVFQDMKECLEFKSKIAQRLNELELKPLYLECKSPEGATSSADDRI